MDTGTREETYTAAASELRTELLAAQQALRRAGGGPVIVVLVGPETAGRGETADLLNAWMDPRWVVTRAWGEPSDEERERPPFWRYWRALPPRGLVAVFLSGWYGPPLLERAEGRIGKKLFDRRMFRIAAFERALADDGAVLVKCLLNVDRRTQRRRLEKFEAEPLRKWRANDDQWRRLRLHGKVLSAWKRAADLTGGDETPWHVIEATDREQRHLQVAACVRDAIRRAIETAPAAGTDSETGSRQERQPAVPDHLGALERQPAVRDQLGALERQPAVYDHLGALDLTPSIDKHRFHVELERQQGRLYRAQRKARERGVSTVVVFEGWDAAGKGGAIRRVTAALDARYFRVIPIAAPTDEEHAHHYLWRFWRHLSRSGHITIFDRSWYGRVLVERVEHLARPDEWQRAYDEINQFEEQLIDHGAVLVKFWLHLSKDEQLSRFHERQRTPYKQWKITDEDWRNRRNWDAHADAVNEMVTRTSTNHAPWVLVEGNDKRFARVKVVQTLAKRIALAARRRR